VAENHGRLYLESSFMEGYGAEFVMVFPLAPLAVEGGGDEPPLAPGIPEWMGLDWLKNSPTGPSGDGIVEGGRTVRSDDGGEATAALPHQEPEEKN
jgi:hypothetical protein